MNDRSWPAAASAWHIWLLTLCASCLNLTPALAQDSPGSILSSDILFEPIKLSVVVPEAKIRQIRVIANFEKSPTKAEVELDMGKVDFNDFGDPHRMGPPDVKRIQVHLVDISSQLKGDTIKHITMYEVKEFQDPKQGVRLLVPDKFKVTDDYRHVELVVYYDGSAANILTLRPHDDDKGANSFEPKLEGTRWSTAKLNIGMSLKEITIDEWDGTTARLHLDPNHTSLSADGISGMSTLMGWQPRQVNIVDTKTVDPLNLGRKLWELTTGSPRRTRYFVVEDARGKHHRLVIKIDDKIRFVTPLVP